MDRDKILRKLAGLTQRQFSPRLAILVILVVAFAAMHLGNIIFLKLGMTTLWVRYLADCLLWYGVFIAALYAWTHYCAILLLHQPEQPLHEEASYTQDTDATIAATDLSFNILSLGEFGPLFLIIAIPVFIASVVFLTWNVFFAAAPGLLAELLLDAGLAGMLYKPLREASLENWLGTAMRRTWGMFVFISLFVVLLGFLITVINPEAHTLGEALSAHSTRP